MSEPLAPGKLISLASDYLPEMNNFTRELVQIRSVNGRENEFAVAERILVEAKHLQLDAFLHAADPQRPNVLATWGRGQLGFVLIGHMDTVAEGAQDAWQYPPFDGQIKDGRLFGRGSADNKAGIACALYTLAMLRDNNMLDPNRVRVVLAGVVDEESGASSQLGVRYLLDQDLLQPARAAIYTYASDIICIGHRGLLRMLLRARGKAVHTGSPAWSRGEEGVNAVTGLAAILVRLESLTLPAPPHPAFDGLSCRMTPGTLMRGGEFESMVPVKAEALVDVRLMPQQPAEQVIQAVQEVITEEATKRPGLSVTVEIKNNLPGVALDPQHQLVKSAQHWARRVTGKEWLVAGAGPANEGYMLIQAGIPTLCGFGPAGGNAHAPDEWVELESLVPTVAMYTGIILDTLDR